MSLPGQRLASALLATDNNGNTAFGPLPFAVPNGRAAIAATATDPAGNTSEFSPCVGGIGRLFASNFEPAAACVVSRPRAPDASISIYRH
jgi:hypothetical protein